MQALKLKWEDIIGNASGRIMLILIAFFIVLSSSFLVYIYYSQLSAFRNTEMAKLQGISKSLAVQIDGDQHKALFDQFSMSDDISVNDQSPYYAEVNALLKKAMEINGLTTDIYTLVYLPKTKTFEFGVSSSSVPFYRHKWTHYDKAHISNYDKGDILGPYTDENGSWLSSFTPIKDRLGNTVAIIQVDEPFDSFVQKVRRKVYVTIAIMVFVLALLIFIMLHVVQKILRKEDKLKLLLNKQRIEIENRNKEILSSITRAKTIQDALLPTIDVIKKVFPEMFVMFQPRDIVSGDFFWFAEKGDSAYFAVADCTGHGVPGGFMSMMGHAILNDVVHKKDMITPAQILQCLDIGLTTMLNENEKSSSDGMDIALIRYCRKSNTMQFAGALRPLIKVTDGKIEKIAGDKFSIGGTNRCKKDFTNHTMQLKTGDSIYLFSDGYADQFGGAKNKKYMSKKFAEFLVFAQEHVMEEQKYLLMYEFYDWKNDEEQIDDVLVAGIKIPSAA